MTVEAISRIFSFKKLVEIVQAMSAFDFTVLYTEDIPFTSKISKQHFSQFPTKLNLIHQNPDYMAFTNPLLTLLVTKRCIQFYTLHPHSNLPKHPNTTLITR